MWWQSDLYRSVANITIGYSCVLTSSAGAAQWALMKSAGRAAMVSQHADGYGWAFGTVAVLGTIIGSSLRGMSDTRILDVQQTIAAGALLTMTSGRTWEICSHRGNLDLSGVWGLRLTLESWGRANARTCDTPRPMPTLSSSLPTATRVPRVAQVALWVTRPFAFLDHCARRHGDAFTMQFPGMPPQVVFSSPGAIRQVFTGDPEVLHAGEGNAFLQPVLGSHSLLLLDRAAHLRQRRLLLPAFHGERMQSYATVMRDVTDAAVDRWPLDRPFALAPELQAITLEVIVRTVFGIEQGPRLVDFSRLLATFADSGNSPMLFTPPLQIDLGPRSPWGRVARTIREVDDALRAEVARRRAEGTAGRGDVLSMMLEARDEHGDPMTDAELRDELVTLLMAGHETTATSLGWALAEILAHPEVAARVDAELRAVVGDGPLQPAQVAQLPYLDATVREVLRLRPILPVVARVLKAPMEIGGYALPAGVMVMPCIYLTHRRPELYPEPEALRPERFLGARVDPYAWLPFGGGTRRCIGMAFALYEMKVVLATILSRARLSLTPGYVARVARRGITLAPSKGTPVVMHARR